MTCLVPFQEPKIQWYSIKRLKYKSRKYQKLLSVTKTYSGTKAYRLSHKHTRECVSVARLFEFMRTSFYCNTISISLKYEDYRIYAEDNDINISIYFRQGVLHLDLLYR